jgi:hypothetical protein
MVRFHAGLQALNMVGLLVCRFLARIPITHEPVAKLGFRLIGSFSGLGEGASQA